MPSSGVNSFLGWKTPLYASPTAVTVQPGIAVVSPRPPCEYPSGLFWAGSSNEKFGTGTGSAWATREKVIDIAPATNSTAGLKYRIAFLPVPPGTAKALQRTVTFFATNVLDHF